VDMVKIDREVASLAETNRDWSVVVQAMTSLAHALRKKVVVVGIESSAQMEQVEGVGCDYAQGHFFARPLPAAAATKFIQSPPRWRLSA
jgi:EAL domain-containing protein (putative c-di-GMP-specific phosphodiesterase class I)